MEVRSCALTLPLRSGDDFLRTKIEDILHADFHDSGHFTRKVEVKRRTTDYAATVSMRLRPAFCHSMRRARELKRRSTITGMIPQRPGIASRMHNIGIRLQSSRISLLLLEYKTQTASVASAAATQHLPTPAGHFTHTDMADGDYLWHFNQHLSNSVSLDAGHSFDNDALVRLLEHLRRPALLHKTTPP